MRTNTCARLGWRFLATVALAVCAPIASGQSGHVNAPSTAKISAESADAHGALINRYCLTCHSQKLKTAGVVLEGLDFNHVGESASVLERVLRKIRAGEMPPPGLLRPPASVAAAFADWLEGALDHAGAANPNPGRPGAHRLNRAEYSNAIRDLLALDTNPGDLLPADDSGYGFDNIGDLLTVSPPWWSDISWWAGKSAAWRWAI